MKANKSHENKTLAS